MVKRGGSASGRRIGSRRRLVATGLAAMAASGVVAAPSSAGSGSTTIFACYSDSTDALSYLKPPATSCPSGSTKISWAEAGPPGAQGKAGAQGAQGKSGANGAQGTQGAQGEAGATGAQGAQGAQGATGVQGAQGKAGATGAQGATGVLGPQGATGTAGPQGALGTAGTAGARGATGPQGATGTRGGQGATGPLGATGPEGAPGAAKGYYRYVTSSVTIPAPDPTVVATFAPSNPGDFAVTDTTDVAFPSSPAVSTRCWLNAVASNGDQKSSTPQAENSQSGPARTLPFTVTGDFNLLAGSQIQVLCSTNEATPDTAHYSELTAMQLSGISNAFGNQLAHRFTRAANAAGLG